MNRTYPKNLFHEEKRASKMKKALESELEFFPANPETAVVLEPSDGSLHRPASAVAAQRAATLSLGSVASVGINHFNAFGHRACSQM
jgi:hypothetical protein